MSCFNIKQETFESTWGLVGWVDFKEHVESAVGWADIKEYGESPVGWADFKEYGESPVGWADFKEHVILKSTESLH